MSKKKDPKQESLESLSDPYLKEELRKMATQDITELLKKATPYFKERVLRCLSRETVMIVRGLLDRAPPGEPK